QGSRIRRRPYLRTGRLQSQVDLLACPFGGAGDSYKTDGNAIMIIKKDIARPFTEETMADGPI
ncbi:MAG TPA: hypothetical protein PK411_04390, partial [Mesotoga infera]|nr:hypothetical protein [Mesotoga infera]HRV00962.1 hypothetical protein [Mesotoga sp.]